MLEVVKNVFGLTEVSADLMPVLVGVCGALTLILTVVFVDVIRDIFRGFSRG